MFWVTYQQPIFSALCEGRRLWLWYIGHSISPSIWWCHAVPLGETQPQCLSMSVLHSGKCVLWHQLMFEGRKCWMWPKELKFGSIWPQHFVPSFIRIIYCSLENLRHTCSGRLCRYCKISIHHGVMCSVFGDCVSYFLLNINKFLLYSSGLIHFMIMLVTQ